VAWRRIVGTPYVAAEACDKTDGIADVCESDKLFY
jgi:hypothetical protein